MTDYSPAAQLALQGLRDASHFQWTLVPILGLIVYAYCNEIGNRNWGAVIAGAAYYGIEWLGEIGNSLVMYFSGYAPLWSEPGPTSYRILVGINVETTLMFMLFGLCIGRVLPADRKLRILGMPNRLFVILAFSLIAATVETLLNSWGQLIWDWKYWGWPHMWSVILFAYAPASAFAVWVHDLPTRRQQFTVLGVTYALAVATFVLFVNVLGWI